jgi:tRNA threonylcarbamoyladenosine biosynthesis protein TsaB
VSNSSSFIVAIDTSTRRGSIALAVGGRLAAVYGLETDAPQSAGLWENMDKLIVQAGKTARAITSVAVVRGPGSFTGLRVGMAAAKGLARALDRPLYGATSLELAARSCGAADDVWALLNAHRGEVYTQRFAVRRDGTVEHRSAPFVASPDEVLAQLGDGPLRLTGDGTELLGEGLDRAAKSRGLALERSPIAAQPGPGWQVAAASPFLAGELASLAFGWESEGREAEDVEPCYVRPSQAEVNLRAGRLGRVDAGGRG